MQTPGLLPFAPLTQPHEAGEILATVIQQIQKIANPRVRDNIMASSSILAGLVLNKDIIQQILRFNDMRESVIYQEILAEGKAEGKIEGKQEVALKMLQSNADIDQIVSSLSKLYNIP